MPALLTVVSGLAAIAIGLLVKLPFPLPSEIAKPRGRPRPERSART